MVFLPDTMPASFQASYTPIESAGTEAQIHHLARIMATQFTAAGLGPGMCVAYLCQLFFMTSIPAEYKFSFLFISIPNDKT